MLCNKCFNGIYWAWQNVRTYHIYTTKMNGHWTHTIRSNVICPFLFKSLSLYYMEATFILINTNIHIFLSHDILSGNKFKNVVI